MRQMGRKAEQFFLGEMEEIQWRTHAWLAENQVVAER